MKSRVPFFQLTLSLSEFEERLPLLSDDFPELIEWWSVARVGRSADDVVKLSSVPIGKGSRSKLIVDVFTPLG